jgi:hypothetical protein
MFKLNALLVKIGISEAKSHFMEIWTALYEYSALTESGSILDSAEVNNIILIMRGHAETVADSADAKKLWLTLLLRKS